MSRNILLLCQYDPYNAAMVVEHINAIYAHSANRIYVLQDFVGRGGVLPEGLNLDDFDAVIFHYSVSVALDSYIAPKTRIVLSEFAGLKIAFIQDEYRFVNKTVMAIRELGIRLLFTCVPDTEVEKVYPSERLPRTVVSLSACARWPVSALSYAHAVVSSSGPPWGEEDHAADRFLKSPVAYVSDFRSLTPRSGHTAG